MDVLLWVLAGVLALVFLAAGAMKVAQPPAKLVAGGFTWVSKFPPGSPKILGGLEVLGAIGVILPAALGIAAVLTPVAAVGLAVTMVGAVVIHLQGKEIPQAVLTTLLLAFAVVVAWGRFGPYSF